jgi:hypothetical protein
VRASTAAPIFFPPERINWDPKDPEKSFIFVDGGVTPYNNPAFLLYRMATHPAYRLAWKPGEQELLITSIGTGASPSVEDNVDDPEKNLVSNLAGLPGSLMYDAAVDQDTNCRAVGRCVYGEPLDSEIGDMIPRDDDGNEIPLGKDLGRAFLYSRYNADLSDEGLEKLGLAHIDSAKVSKLDSIDYIDDLREVGRLVAGTVRPEHFGSFLEPEHR